MKTCLIVSASETEEFKHCFQNKNIKGVKYSSWLRSYMKGVTPDKK